MVQIIHTFCIRGSRRVIYDLILKFIDAPMPENGQIHDAQAKSLIVQQLSSDHHLLVTSGTQDDDQEAIKIWSMHDGSLKHHLDEGIDRDGVHTCLFTSDNQRLISAGTYVRVWSVTKGILIHTFPQCHPHICILSPNDKYVLWTQLFTNNSPSVYMWSLDTFMNVGVFHGHTGINRFVGIYWMEFRNHSQELLTAGEDNTIRLWNVETQTCTHTFEGHSERVVSCSVARDEQSLVSSSHDKTVKIWQIDTAENIRTFYGHAAKIERCSFVNNDAWVASLDSAGTMLVWRVEDGSIVHTFAGIHSWAGITMNYYYSHGRPFKPSSWVHLEPSEYLLLSSTLSQTELQVVEVESGRTAFTFPDHTYGIFTAMVADGRILISSSWDTTIRFWNLTKNN